MSNHTSPLVRRNRARALGTVLFATAILFAIMHALGQFWTVTPYFVTAISLALVAILVIFRGDAIYDRATADEPHDELAVRRLLRG